MSAKLEKFVLNTSGVGELLKSPEIIGELQNVAAARCPAGYVTSVYVGKSRANVSIGAESEDTIKDNLENNTLLRSIS